MNFKSTFTLLVASSTFFSCGVKNTSSTVSTDVTPVQLFNGQDIEDWVPKIRYKEVGDNYANTFRVEDGLLKVRYDGYEDFNQQYGHLAYKSPYSYYILRVEYRFVGDQTKGGEGWAWRNSGAMLHGQAPETMLKDQDFPISIEGQILGGDNDPNSIRTTSNLCTPGTNVIYQDNVYTRHCVNSNSKTYHGDQWVTADFVVLGDSVIKHVLEGDVVLEYYKPQIGGGNVDGYDPKQKQDGKAINAGYIYLQSESHPIDFRKVELYDLDQYKNSPEKLNTIINKVLKMNTSN